VVVGHDVTGACISLVVLATELAHRNCGVRDSAGGVSHDPEVLERRVATEELLVDGARAARVLPAAETVVEDDGA
jgi:hypothetical protein